MALYLYGGELLLVGGELAESEDCCCGYASCEECVDAVTSIDLTLSGFPDEVVVEDVGGGVYISYTLFNLNDNYTLTEVSPDEFCIILGVDCGLGTVVDPSLRGIPVKYSLFTLGAFVLEEISVYCWKICVELDCIDGDIRARVVFYFQRVRTILSDEPVNTCVALGVDDCLGVSFEMQEAWEDVCNGDGQLEQTEEFSCVYIDPYDATAVVSLNS